MLPPPLPPLPCPVNGGKGGASLTDPELSLFPLDLDAALGLDPLVSLDLELEFLSAEGAELSF